MYRSLFIKITFCVDWKRNEHRSVQMCVCGIWDKWKFYDFLEETSSTLVEIAVNLHFNQVAHKMGFHDVRHNGKWLRANLMGFSIDNKIHFICYCCCRCPWVLCTVITCCLFQHSFLFHATPTCRLFCGKNKNQFFSKRQPASFDWWKMANEHTVCTNHW